MRFSICNEFCEGWKIEDVFQMARRIGYDGVEIAPFTLAESVTAISAAERARIREAAARTGIEIVGLHWLLVSPKGLYINCPDDVLRRKTRDYLIELIHFCGDLGGRVMVLGSPKQRNVLDGQTYAATWERTKTVFWTCARAAEERGVTLCIEPLGRGEANFIYTAQEAIRMAQEVNSPNFKIILDVKAMSDEGRPLPEIIRSAKAWVGHFHANDANRRGPGFGDTDFAPIFAALKDIRYAGYVSVEVFDFKPDPETIARKSFDYMQATLRNCAGDQGSPGSACG